MKYALKELLNPKKQSDEHKLLIDKLLLERVPLAGIARVTGVSERWLQNYVIEKYESLPQSVIVSSIRKGRLTIECDELWDSLPTVYRQCAVSYTDFWESYENIFPSTRHRPVGKETGQTNHIWRGTFISNPFSKTIVVINLVQ